MLWWLLSCFFLSAKLQGIAAQSDATCLPFYDWTFNSQKKSPCEVASSLLAVCNGGPFPVEALPDLSHYVGPSLGAANPCQCNTVTYSLMSACGACQGRTYLSWSVWSANCATVEFSSYPEPIPLGTSVPGWAYLDVQSEDNFDQTLAKQNANITESTAVPSSTASVSSTSTASITITSTTKQSSSSVAPITPPPQATSTGSSSSSTAALATRANAVGGGVIGGLLGLLLIGGLLTWFFKRKQSAAQNGEPLRSPTDVENPSWNGEGPYMRQDHDISGPQSSVGPSINSSLATPAMFTANSSIAESIGHPRA
ncbi:hypothetical protein B0H34DRAFT_324108 [Crassisporium funariophilum]|nr:hypothetical protein B0H34DRAFT_324108 [Crassisporium funariophilum]